MFRSNVTVCGNEFNKVTVIEAVSTDIERQQLYFYVVFVIWFCYFKMHVKLCCKVRNPPTFKTNPLIGTYISFRRSANSVIQQSGMKLVQGGNT